MALEQEFLNYARDDGGNVSVPRRLRAGRNTSDVELAYITPEEQGILSALRPGSPHRGPMEVPSYDDIDATGRYRSSEQLDYGGGTRAFGPSSVTGQGGAGVSPDIAAFNKAQWQQKNIPYGQRNIPRQRGQGFFGGLRRGLSNITSRLGDWFKNKYPPLGDPTSLNALGSYYTDEERYDRQMQAFREKYGKNNVQPEIDRDLDDMDTGYARTYLSSLANKMPPIQKRTRTFPEAWLGEDQETEVGNYPERTRTFPDEAWLGKDQETEVGNYTDPRPLQFRDPQQYFMENTDYERGFGYDRPYKGGPIGSTGLQEAKRPYINYQELNPSPYSFEGRYTTQEERQDPLWSEFVENREYNPLLQQSLINQKNRSGELFPTEYIPSYDKSVSDVTSLDEVPSNLYADVSAADIKAIKGFRFIIGGYIFCWKKLSTSVFLIYK